MPLVTTMLQASSNQASADGADPLALLDDDADRPDMHQVCSGVLCETEPAGHEQPASSLLEIVLDASEGFVPLWKPGVVLRWRFNAASFARLANPAVLQSAIEKLLGEAIMLWGDAAPVRFTQRDDAWDFEIVMAAADKCMNGGCVLASAFFPDAGRHQLVIYPKMFSQDHQEQVETLAHEIGHVFGLRHFFALVSETAFPSVVFGDHDKFSIMNYGADSRMSDADRSDLKTLYRQVWAGQLNAVNGTPIRLMEPYHDSGVAPGALLAAA